MVSLLDEEQAKQRIRGYLNSGEWWLFMAPAAGGSSKISDIEEEFYSREANADFHLILSPPFPGLCFGKKSRCSPAQLSRYINGVYSVVTSEEELRQRDIIALSYDDETDDDETDVGAGVLAAFLQWIGRL